MTDTTRTRFQLGDLVTHNGRPAEIAGVYPDVKGQIRYHVTYVDGGPDEGQPDAAFFLLGRVISPREA